MTSQPSSHPGFDLTQQLAAQLAWHWDSQLRPRLNGLTDEVIHHGAMISELRDLWANRATIE